MNLVTETFLKERKESLCHRMKGYKQINVKYASEQYYRPSNEYENDSSMTNKVNGTNLMHVLLLGLKK